VVSRGGSDEEWGKEAHLCSAPDTDEPALHTHPPSTLSLSSPHVQGMTVCREWKSLSIFMAIAGDDDSYTGGHGVVTAGNLQAWRDIRCVGTTKSSWALV